jgi:hypothetical protein
VLEHNNHLMLNRFDCGLCLGKKNEREYDNERATIELGRCGNPFFKLYRDNHPLHNKRILNWQFRK